MATVVPRALQPPNDPPTTALPALPQPKTRHHATVSHALRLPSAIRTPSKPAIQSLESIAPADTLTQAIKPPSGSILPPTTPAGPLATRSGIRTPSTVSIPRVSLPAPGKSRTVLSGTALKPLHAYSTPIVPTLKTIPNTPEAISTPSADRSIRRSISISAFPNPPKVTTRIGSLARPSLGGTSATLPSEPNRHDSQDSSSTGVTQIRTLRHKKPKSSNDSLRKVYTFSNSPTLLNGSGDAVSISAGSGQQGSDGLLSIHSPSQSRTSSAQGSYSTSATTFEDVEEVPRRGRDGSQSLTPLHESRSNGKESQGNVIVSVRVRPDAGKGKDARSEGEWSRSEGEWMVDGRRSLVAYRGREGGDYYYDNVFAPHDGNERVYDSSAKRLVRQVMEGYHGTVFAYGMTGTGKTFSMNGTTMSPGIIPQAITDIFSYIRETPRREFLLRVSYLEIYNEKIHDLLSVDPSEGVASQQEEIKLREDSKRGVYATPLKEEIVQSPTQLLRVISRGDQARKTGRTQWNAHSSRSHAVVQIVVESRERAITRHLGNEDKRAPFTPGGVRVSTLSLIDLAGSERAAEDKTRRTEGSHINKSLLTLGTIISRLSGGKDKAGNPVDKDGQHLPYRDSKLTRLLQPALSGNSLISILCTIQIGSAGSAAVANNHTGETLNTLKFASRAKNNIVSHAKRAEEAKGSSTDAASGALLEQYRMEIQGLRGQLERQMKEQAEKEEKLMEKEEKQRHGDTLLDMQLARTALKERIEHLNRIIITSQSTGVNSGKFSSLSMHPKLVAYDISDRGSRSLRSSASHSTLHRTTSGASNGTQITATALDALQSPTSPFDMEDDTTGAFGDGEATLQSQIRSLRHDLTAKNRYISTLERRVDQARRSSHNRNSYGLGPTAAQAAYAEQALQEKDIALREKDSELAQLRSRLDDQERTIASLRATAARLGGAESLSSPAATPVDSAAPFAIGHTPQLSTGGSDASSNSASLSPVELLSSPPAQSLLPAGTSKLSLGITDVARDKRRESVDEMSRMLDQMIQSRVEQGDLIRSQRGSIRAKQERRKESLGNVPTIGALAKVLRPESQWLDGEEKAAKE